MSKFLFDVQQKNRLSQKGLLKRFSIICYGHQESVEEMKSLKAKKIVELKGQKGTREYDEWFLKYNPMDADSRLKKNASSSSIKPAALISHSKTKRAKKVKLERGEKTEKRINYAKTKSRKHFSRYHKKPKRAKKYWEIY
jgi:hypothetical protein